MLVTNGNIYVITHYLGNLVSMQVPIQGIEYGLLTCYVARVGGLTVSAALVNSGDPLTDLALSLEVAAVDGESRRNTVEKG